jgi:hypothetical protein
MQAQTLSHNRVAVMLLVLTLASLLCGLGFHLARVANEHRVAGLAGEVYDHLAVYLEMYPEEHGGFYPPLGHVRGVVPAAVGDWHYEEGLTQNDDPDLALAWSKRSYVGGQDDDPGTTPPRGKRSFLAGYWGRPERSRWVVLVGGTRLAVPEAEWPDFLSGQEELLAKRDGLAKTGGPVLVGRIRFPTGEEVSRYDGLFVLETHYTPDRTASSLGKGEGHGTTSGPGPGPLGWRARQLRNENDGENTWVLTLPDRRLKSKPVKFTMRAGRATPSTIVFEMEPMK